MQFPAFLAKIAHLAGARSSHLGMGRVPFFWRGTGLGPFFLAHAGSRVKKILLGSCSGPKKIARVHFGSHFFPKYHTNLT